MSGVTPTGAVHLVERQIRQVRRRRNVHALQRALYLLVAVAALAGASLLLSALRAGRHGFAVALWCIGSASLTGVVLIVRTLRRHWLGAARAPGWIDRRAGLRGLLSTLVQRDRFEGAFFYPLLAAQNGEALPRWKPERLVPRAVPRGPLAVALAAIGILVLLIAFAARLRPSAPELFYSDQPIDARRVSGLRGIPDRVLLAPVGSSEHFDDEDLDSMVAAPGQTADERTALAYLPETLQERIRRQLWGQSWEAARDAMARAQKPRGERADGDDTASRGEALESARSGEDMETPGPAGDVAGERRDGGERIEPGEELAPPEALAADGADAAGRGAAAGAGTNTDPNLFGPPTGSTGAGSRFELALGARVHGPRPGGHRPAGEPPPPTPDARPALAPRSRAEAAQHRMPVPPAYEAIVREVFAHRTAPSETLP